jgi:hypothetical protein
MRPTDTQNLQTYKLTDIGEGNECETEKERERKDILLGGGAGIISLV